MAFKKQLTASVTNQSH